MASPGFFARSPTTASCLQHTALPSLGSSRLAALSLDGCTYSAGHPPHVLVADGPDAVARSLAGADRALPTFRLSRAPRRAGARSPSTRPRRTTRSGRKSSTWARNRRGGCGVGVAPPRPFRTSPSRLSLLTFASSVHSAGSSACDRSFLFSVVPLLRAGV